jgi:hypothetical protein
MGDKGNSICIIEPISPQLMDPYDQPFHACANTVPIISIKGITILVEVTKILIILSMFHSVFYKIGIKDTVLKKFSKGYHRLQ